MSLPYFNLYPSDFEAKTSHLTLEEDGAYNRLLRLCWMTPGCSLPDDDAWIMRRMRVDAETYERVVRVVLDEFFTRANGRVTNPRIAREAVASAKAHKRRVDAGKRGGAAKSAKTKETAPSNAKAMPKQPEPEPDIYSEANASDAGGVDFAKAIFENGVRFLCQHGATEDKARKVIGLWRKEYTDKEIFDAFANAKRSGVIDPIPWITETLKGKPNGKSSRAQERVNAFIAGARGSS